MLKKLILLFVLFSPVVQIVLISLSFGEGRGEAFAQVVIKDEIVLDETEFREVDGASVTSPFYGRIYFRKNCTNFGRGDKAEVSAGGQSWTFPTGCVNFACDIGSWCFCIAGYWEFHNFLDMPSGTAVTVNMQYCNGSVWEFIEIPLQFSYAGNNTYNLLAQNPEGGGWADAGFVKFFDETPPGNCPNAGGNYCDSTSWVQVPDVELVPDPNSNVISTYCSTHPNTIAAFSPATDHRTNLYDINESNVIACYNQTSQTWQFNLDQNVKIYYQIGICSTNVSNKNLTYINDTTDIEDITSGDCNIALISFKAHKEYKWDALTQTYGLNIPDDGYLIKEAILEHENQHKVRYEEFMNDYLFLWESKINTFQAVCSTYTDIFEAKKGGYKMYWDAFFGETEYTQYFYTKFNTEYQKRTGLFPHDKVLRGKDEKRANNKPEVQNLIEKYINKLETHCSNN